jgi:hypothetical protein
MHFLNDRVVYLQVRSMELKPLNGTVLGWISVNPDVLEDEVVRL